MNAQQNGKTIQGLIDENLQLAQHVYETKDSIVINVRYEYVIEKFRIDTAEKIIRWAVHLSEKNWMTKKILSHFLLVACRAAGIEPFGV